MATAQPSFPYKKERQQRNDKHHARMPYKSRKNLDTYYENALSRKEDSKNALRITSSYDMMEDCRNTMTLEKLLKNNDMKYSTLQNGEAGQIYHQPTGLSITFGIKPHSTISHKIYNLNKLITKIEMHKNVIPGSF